MTDLETACRELVKELRKEGDVLTHKNQYKYERAKGKAMYRTADRLERALEEHTTDGDE